MTGMQVRRVILVAVAALLVPLAAPMAWAQDDAAVNLAKGVVQYDGKLMTPSDLFGLYQAAHQNLTALQDKNKVSQDHITDINKQITQIQADYMKAKHPLDVEHAKLVGVGQLATSQVNAPPPSPPIDPGYYATYQYRNLYQQQVNDYYNKKAQWDRDRVTGQQSLQTQQVAMADCNQRLADLLKLRDETQKPLLADRQQTQDAMKPVSIEITATLGKLKAMGDALRTAPEAKRLALGIVEYKEVFYSVAEFQAAVNKIVAELEAARLKVKENAGGTVPEGWRHPKQDEADAMAVLLQKVKAAVAAAPPVVPAVPTTSAAPAVPSTPAKVPAAPVAPSAPVTSAKATTTR